MARKNQIISLVGAWDWSPAAARLFLFPTPPKKTHRRDSAGGNRLMKTLLLQTSRATCVGASLALLASFFAFAALGACIADYSAQNEAVCVACVSLVFALPPFVGAALLSK